MRARRLTVKIHHVELEKGWADTLLRVTEYDNGNIRKQAVIRIEGPTDVIYLREKLDEIEAYWKERLGVK